MNKTKLICETPIYKVMLVRESNIPVTKKSIQSPEDAAKIMMDYLRGTDREHFVGMYLNTTNALITVHTISIGILNSSLVHPREVFKMACMVNEPSSEDISITKQLVEAGKILGIPLHDHIIVTDGNGYMSFADRGLL
jgi:DNA repair protein RadC